jgi:hypothetical protein
MAVVVGLPLTLSSYTAQNSLYTRASRLRTSRGGHQASVLSKQRMKSFQEFLESRRVSPGGLRAASPEDLVARFRRADGHRRAPSRSRWS